MFLPGWLQWLSNYLLSSCSLKFQSLHSIQSELFKAQIIPWHSSILSSSGFLSHLEWNAKSLLQWPGRPFIIDYLSAHSPFFTNLHIPDSGTSCSTWTVSDMFLPQASVVWFPLLKHSYQNFCTSCFLNSFLYLSKFHLLRDAITFTFCPLKQLYFPSRHCDYLKLYCVISRA